jgi:hypothetical protein
MRLQKGRVMGDSLVQQIGRTQQICLRSWGKAHSEKKILGARIEVKSNEIRGRWTLDGQFLSWRDVGVEAFCDFLRDLVLNREHVFQIAIVLLRPDVRIGARVDQLGVHMEPGPGLSDAAFQHVRNAQRIADLARISLAAILHHAGPTDYFEISNFRQLGQNVVLDAVGKGGVLSVAAQVFKW